MTGGFASDVDPITLQVLIRGLQSIADEMVAALVRTAYSTNIKDRRDCSAAIYSVDGDVITQCELGTPLHLGTMLPTVQTALQTFPATSLRQGDGVIINTPYPAGPGHLNDIGMLSPVVWEDEVVALVANTAHHVDVGGFAPGSMPFGVSEIYQEGLQIPAVRLFKESRLDDELYRLISQNVRTNREFRGDIMAQAGANHVGTQRVRSLLERHGPQALLRHFTAILDHAAIPLYEDVGVDCLQIGEPNSRNTVLLNALRNSDLPVIHKRGNAVDCEDYLLWVERMMTCGKENIVLCERGIGSANKYTRNTLDLGSVAAFHYQLTGLPVAVDASHGCGVRDLVHPLTVASVFAGASVLLLEAHPNPLIAKSDGFQALFPEQLANLVQAAQQAHKLRKDMEHLYVPSRVLESDYEGRVETDRERLFAE